MKFTAKFAGCLLALSALASANAFAQQSTASGQVAPSNQQDSSSLMSTGSVDANAVYQPGSTVTDSGGSSGDTAGFGG